MKFPTNYHIPWMANDALVPDGFRQYPLALILSTLAINLLSLGLPVMTVQVYDRILPNPESGTLAVLIVGVCVAVVLETILRLCRAYFHGRAGAAYEHRMSCLAMQKVLNADLSRMQSHGVGEHLHRMSSINKMKEFYNGYALVTLSELIFIPISLGLMAYIGGMLALIPATVLACFIWFSLRQGRGLREALHKREIADDKRFNFLVETLEGVHTVKSAGLEKYFERRYEALEEDSGIANYEVTRKTASTFNGSAIFSHIMVAGVITAGAWSVLNGMLTTGGLIATLLLSGRMMQPVQKALGLWIRYQDYLLARNHADGLFRTPQHETSAIAENDNDRIIQGQLDLEQLSFGFPDKDEPLLRNISLNLEKGKVVLVQGEHGAGKTTLLNVIAGIYPATSGMVRLDDYPVQSFTSTELARHIGYIRSHPIIFRGTIRDNITGFGQIPEKEAREIAILMETEKEIARLPAGFDTFLSGNDTDSVSPGLKQRIAIVRALASKPKLILFDNADRTLDREGYMTMYRLLARLKGKATLILVSDDRNICSLADMIYLLENGSLTELHASIKTHQVQPYRELRI